MSSDAVERKDLLLAIDQLIENITDHLWILKSDKHQFPDELDIKEVEIATGCYFATVRTLFFAPPIIVDKTLMLAIEVPVYPYLTSSYVTNPYLVWNDEAGGYLATETCEANSPLRPFEARELRNIKEISLLYRSLSELAESVTNHLLDREKGLVAS